MSTKIPKVNVDILVVKGDKILLGLLTDDWSYRGKQVYGVPGSDIQFGEKIGKAVKRYIKKHTGCALIKYKIIAINANYAFGNHYIGIGVLASITDEPKVVAPEEWVKWEWFSKGKIPKNLFPPAKNLIDCYLKNKITISE